VEGHVVQRGGVTVEALGDVVEVDHWRAAVMIREMTQFLLVCLGGAVGSGTRYAVALAVPHGTLLVNLLGSFAIAVVLETMRASDMRLLIVTGFLGGFTTYSAFNQETLQFARAGDWGSAAGNVVVTVVGCLAAGALGLWIARKLWA
jgi:CrcB protein